MPRAYSFKPLSVTYNSFGSRTAVAGNVGASVVVHVVAAAVREPTLLFVTEMGFTGKLIWLKMYSSIYTL